MVVVDGGTVADTNMCVGLGALGCCAATLVASRELEVVGTGRDGALVVVVVVAGAVRGMAPSLAVVEWTGGAADAGGVL